MTAAILMARLALAMVLLVAGVAKLADRRGSRDSLAAIGIPTLLLAPIALALPVIELITGVALFPAASAALGAWGALVLTAAFTVGVAGILIRGVKTDCHCFGQLHSSPVGWRTLGRNVVLTVIAIFVAVGQRGSGAPSYGTWFGRFTGTEWLALSAMAFALTSIAAAAWFGVHLMRQHGRILLRLDALEGELRGRGLISMHGATVMVPKPPGAPAPAFDARNLAGGSTSLRELLAPGHPLLLIFARPGCAPCTALIPEIAAWRSDGDGILTLGLITQGPIGDYHRQLVATGVRHVLVQNDSEINDMFAVRLSPSAVLIAGDGTIAGGIAEGAPAIRELVASGLGSDPDLRRRFAEPVASPPAGRRPARDVSTTLVSLDAR